MRTMEDIPEVIAVVTPGKTVADQILEAPIGSVFAETARGGKGPVPYRTVTRTGMDGWWVTGLEGYWHTDDIVRWVEEHPLGIVVLHIAP